MRKLIAMLCCFVGLLANASVFATQPVGYIKYVVRDGNSLERIADAHRVSLKEILGTKGNEKFAKRPDLIHPKEIVVIPVFDRSGLEKVLSRSPATIPSDNREENSPTGMKVEPYLPGERGPKALTVDQQTFLSGLLLLAVSKGNPQTLIPVAKTGKIQREQPAPENLRIVEETAVAPQVASTPVVAPTALAASTRTKKFVWQNYNADPCGENCGPDDLKRVLKWECADALKAKIALGETDLRPIPPQLSFMMTGKDARLVKDFPVRFKDGKTRIVPSVQHVCGDKLVTVYLAECNNFPGTIEKVEQAPPPVIQPAPEERDEFPVVYGPVCDCALRHRSDLPDGPYSIHTGFMYPSFINQSMQ